MATKAGSLADIPTIINMPGRIVNAGVVYVKNCSKVSPCPHCRLYCAKFCHLWLVVKYSQKNFLVI